MRFRIFLASIHAAVFSSERNVEEVLSYGWVYWVASSKAMSSAIVCDCEPIKLYWRLRYSSWLGHYATIRKVAGLIPDGVIGIFRWLNPSGRTMALGSTLTEVNSRVICWGKGGRCVGLTTLPPSCADCLEILGASTSWRPKGLSRDCLPLFSHNNHFFFAKGGDVRHHRYV